MKKSKPFVANAISDARKEKKMTQKELASIIGKSEIAIRKYEGGDSIPPYSVIWQIAQVLDKDASELMGLSLNNMHGGTTGYHEFVDKEYAEIKKYIDPVFNVLTYTEFQTPDQIEIVLLLDDIRSRNYSRMKLIENVSKIKMELKREFEEKLKKEINEHLMKLITDEEYCKE